jgi:hypothetical protein
MAKCERIDETPVPPPPTYRLELSDDEARFIRTLLGQLGFDGGDEWWRLRNSIWEALSGARVPLLNMKIDATIHYRPVR